MLTDFFAPAVVLLLAWIIGFTSLFLPNMIVCGLLPVDLPWLQFIGYNYAANTLFHVTIPVVYNFSGKTTVQLH